MAQSAKQRFLDTHDVLLRIFSYFIPVLSDESSPQNYLSRGGFKQLRDIALVCKAFMEPALICLWSHLPAVEQLWILHPACQVWGDRIV